MIAFTGQFDGLLTQFYSWFRRSAHVKSESSRMIGIYDAKVEGFPQLDWRTGSLLSAREVTSMLADIRVLVCFYMTPPEDIVTHQGHARDVALTSAVNIARCANAQPDLRVILVTRMFPQETSSFDENYEYLENILHIFKTNCKNIDIIQCSPVISEYDVISLAMFEHALFHAKNHTKCCSSHWTNLTQPMPERAFFKALHAAILAPSSAPSIQFLQGCEVLSYQSWFDILLASIPLHIQRKTLAHIKMQFMPCVLQRSRILDETIKFPTAENGSQVPGELSLGGKKNFAMFVDDLLENRHNPRSLLASTDSRLFQERETACYVQRVIKNPNRSVSEMADLMMQWLPRYFQRMLRVEDIDSDRVLCRVSRVPLLELKKVEESSTRCRLYVRFPWAKSVTARTSLLITTSGSSKSPGILLVVIEDSPDNAIFKTSMRMLLHAFGKYLKDYSCGE